MRLSALVLALIFFHGGLDIQVGQTESAVRGLSGELKEQAPALRVMPVVLSVIALPTFIWCELSCSLGAVYSQPRSLHFLALNLYSRPPPVA